MSPNTDAQIFEKFEEERQGTLQYMKESGVSVTNIKIVSLEEDGDKAVAKISQTFVGLDQEQTDTVKMDLEKVEDVWYLVCN